MTSKIVDALERYIDFGRGDLLTLEREFTLLEGKVKDIQGSLPSRHGGHSIASGSISMLPEDGLSLYDPVSGKRTVHLNANGTVGFGWNADLAEGNAFRVFSQKQYFNSELFGKGDALWGDNTSGKANMLWDYSAGQLKFRGGTTTNTYIDVDGTIHATSGVFSGTITATLGYIGGFTIGTSTLTGGSVVLTSSGDGHIDVGNIDIDGSGYIQSSNYQSGVSGFHLNQNGYAEFDNVRVRGTLQTAVFEYNTINATAGTMAVVYRATTLYSDLDLGTDTSIFLANDSVSGTACSFTVGQVIRLRGVSEGLAFKDVWVTLGGTKDQQAEYAEFTAYTAEDGNLTSNWTAGAAVLGYEPTSGAAIYLTADGAVGSAANISIVTHATEPWTDQSLKVRLGNLSGVTYNGSALSGYGLYSDNAYLEGELISGGGYVEINEAGGITFSATGADDVRHYLTWYKEGDTTTKALNIGATISAGDSATVGTISVLDAPAVNNAKLNLQVASSKGKEIIRLQTDITDMQIFELGEDIGSGSMKGAYFDVNAFKVLADTGRIDFLGVGRIDINTSETIELDWETNLLWRDGTRECNWTIPDPGYIQLDRGILVQGYVFIGTIDTSLYRSAADTLNTPDSFTVGGVFRAQGGQSQFGVNGGTRGYLQAYGGGSTAGGLYRTYAGASSDTYTDYWEMGSYDNGSGHNKWGVLAAGGSSPIGLALSISDIGDVVIGAEVGTTNVPAGDATLWINKLTLGYGADTYVDSKMQRGISLVQGGYTDNILSFKNTNVAHGLTSWNDTNTWGAFSPYYGGDGGLTVFGMSDQGDVGNVIGLHLASIAGYQSNTKSTAAKGSVNIDGSQKSGTTGGGLSSGYNIVSIASWGNCRFVFANDGDIYADATYNSNSWDELEDAELVRALEVNRSKAGIIRNEFDKFLRYNRKDVEDAGLATFNDGEGEDGSTFVNYTGLTRLHSGAIWQLHTKIMRLVDKLDELGVVDKKELLEAVN